MHAYLFHLLKRLVDFVRPDIRARFQPLNIPPLRNRHLHRRLILFEHRRALLQRLLCRPRVQALIAQRVPQDHTLADRLRLVEVRNRVPRAAELAERARKGRVRLGRRDRNELVSHLHMRRAERLARLGDSVHGLRGVEERALELRALKARALQRLVLVGHAAADEREAAAGAAARARRGRVAEVGLDERAQLLVAEQDRVVAHAREPALEHDLHQPVVLLVGWRGRLCEGQRGHDCLRAGVHERLGELLEFGVGALHVPVCRPREVGQVSLHHP